MKDSKIKILFIGDVYGQKSCQQLINFLPNYKNQHDIDLTIVNGENSANGNGITPFSANLLLSAADVITTGNHCFKRIEMNNMYDENTRVLRPYNLGKEVRGAGYTILDMGNYSIGIINLMGNVFMPPSDNPFKEVAELLKTIYTPNIIVDFHGEATSEKKSMGFHLATKVSAVIGTHTHIQTADEQIISNHTAYITDVGMTGIHDSVIGAEKDTVVRRFLTYRPTRHLDASGDISINGVIITINYKTGRALDIIRVNQII